MKLLAALCLSLTLGSLPPRVARAQTPAGPVRVEVRATGGASYDRIRGSNAMKANETKRLEIILATTAGQFPAGLTARWTIYGRKLGDNSLTALGSGDVPFTVGAGRTQTLATEPVSMSSTPAHGVVSGGGRRRGNVKVKKVEAEGARYAGYGVQVLQGAAVVGESFSSPALKEQVPGVRR